MNECFHCKNTFSTEDLRPYGPNGALICFDCGMETPERKALASEMFQKVLDLLHSDIVILTPTGPSAPADVLFDRNTR